MKVALIQQKYHNSKEKTIQKTLSLIEEAVEKKADLVILQELHQSNYFCITEDVENFKLANNFNEDKKFWANISKKFDIVLVTSLFEKRAPGIYHNTSVVFDKGIEAGMYRKMHIPDDPGFYEKFYFTPGDLGFKPIDTSVGRLGVLICWDQWYPEAARIMALNGAEILIYPTAIGWFDKDSESEKLRQLESWIAIQRAHAIANGIPVVAVNRVGFEKDKSNAIDGIRFWGNSFVFNGGGELLVKGSEDKEEVIICEIDKNESENFRIWWPFFRDRRIDSYETILKRYNI